jgi:hypothetical protein
MISRRRRRIILCPDSAVAHDDEYDGEGENARAARRNGIPIIGRRVNFDRAKAIKDILRNNVNIGRRTSLGISPE